MTKTTLDLDDLKLSSFDAKEVLRFFHAIEESDVVRKRKLIVESSTLWTMVNKLFEQGWSWKRICPVLEKAKIRRPKQTLSWEPKRATPWFYLTRKRNEIEQAGNHGNASANIYKKIKKLRYKRGPDKQRTWAQIRDQLNEEGLTNSRGGPWTATAAQKFFNYDRNSSKGKRTFRKTAFKGKRKFPKPVRTAPPSSQESVVSKTELLDGVTVVRPTNGRTVLLFDGVHLDIKFLEQSFNIEALWLEKGSVSKHIIL